MTDAETYRLGPDSVLCLGPAANDLWPRLPCLPPTGATAERLRRPVPALRLADGGWVLALPGLGDLRGVQAADPRLLCDDPDPASSATHLGGV